MKSLSRSMAKKRILAAIKKSLARYKKKKSK